MAFLDKFRRVNRAEPCPVCGRSDWCAVSRDGAVALCHRVETPRRIGEAGWLHRLRDIPWWPARRGVRTVRMALLGDGRAGLDRLTAECQRAVDPGRLHQLASSLGLSVEGLTRLGIGWSGGHRTWTFPMCDCQRTVLGIRLRYPEWEKAIH
jgi:hypothetical protein